VTVSLATGTFTFLFTDIEGSTALLGRLGAETYAQVLAKHHQIIREALSAHGGTEIGTHGDAFFAVFSSPRPCVAAVIAMQRALSAHHWPEIGALRVRMGVHSGVAAKTTTGLVGYDVHRAARVAAVAHGAQVLLSSAAMDLVRDALPEGVSVRDLGLHRLKDLNRPEHIFQLEAPGLERDFPLLRSLDNPALANNLPAQSARFIGRERELADLRSLIESHRVVTLTGAGGSGKTRLALQVAAELLDGSGEGVWLVELAALADKDAVVPAIAETLHVSAEPGRPMLESLVEALASQRILILLDNCEHVLGACARVVDNLVRSCPDLHLVCTSREPLGIAGEAIYRIPSLSLLDDDGDGPTTHGDAVALFLDRAATQGAALRVDDANLALLVSLCRRLDGMPLAIELAAARMRTLSLADLSGRLDQRFRLLTGGSRTALPRQQTLRATVDWSYSLLNEVEQAALRRLSVFAGGFDLQAAEAVVSLDDIEVFDIADVVSSLVDKSLVVAEPAGDRLRYRLLETIREYAEELLGAGTETNWTLSRHAEHFASFAERARTGREGGDERLWTPLVEAEQANFRAALTWAVGRGDAVLAARIIVALNMHAWFHLWSEFDQWARSATDLIFRASKMPDELAAAAEAAAAFFAWGAGDSERASLLVDRGMQRPARGDLPTAMLYLSRAAVALTSGNITEAVTADQEAAAWARRSGNAWWTSIMIAHLVMSTAASSDTQAAITLGREALAIARRVGSSTPIAFSAFALADTIIDEDPDTAAEYLAGADAEMEAADLGFMLGLTRGSLVFALGRSSNPLRSVPGYLELLEQWRTGGTVAHLRATARNAAEMLVRVGRPDVTASVNGAMQALGSEPPAGSPEARRLEAAVTKARKALGSEFDELFRRGKDLTDDDLVSLVRDALAGLEDEESQDGNGEN
jgi:predicted ATPase/class 3 adenylate cyclase